MDFVVATPCNALSVASTNDAIDDQKDVEGITKSPSRSEFSSLFFVLGTCDPVN